MDIENVAGFEWDSGNIDHCQKHGVTLGEIEALFSNTPHVLGDPFAEERRFRAIGRNNAKRFMYVVFMLRKRGAEFYIRPISARYMHKKEIDHYEKR